MILQPVLRMQNVHRSTKPSIVQKPASCHLPRRCKISREMPKNPFYSHLPRTPFANLAFAKRLSTPQPAYHTQLSLSSISARGPRPLTTAAMSANFFCMIQIPQQSLSSRRLNLLPIPSHYHAFILIVRVHNVSDVAKKDFCLCMPFDVKRRRRLPIQFAHPVWGRRCAWELEHACL